MLKEYNKEQLWKVYQKLPEDLKEVIFSEITADTISDICQRNGIVQVSEVTEIIGFVLLGILPVKELQESLRKELRIKTDLAEKVAQEINRFIIYPVKKSLDAIHGIQVPPLAPKPEPKTAPEKEEKPVLKKQAPLRKDTYREPIEQK